MLQEILEGSVLLYVMAALCAFGVLSKLAVWISYRRLMKATQNMSASKNTLTTQLRLKFENCYKLNLNVQNVPAFVDKYLQKYKVCGMRVHTAGRILQVMLLLNGMIGVAGCAGIIWLGLDIPYLVRDAAAAVLSVMVLYLIDYMLDVEDKREIVVTNLQDYLDNVLTNRLQHTYESTPGNVVVEKPEVKKLFPDADAKAQTAAASLRIKSPKAKKARELGAGTAGRKPKADAIDEEEVIREILREFLT